MDPFSQAALVLSMNQLSKKEKVQEILNVLTGSALKEAE
jgi:hypothetical protein